MRFMTVMRCHFLKKIDSFASSNCSIRHFQRQIRNNKTFFASGLSKKVDNVERGNLWKQFKFTILFSGATFVGCTIAEYERVRAQLPDMFVPFLYQRIQVENDQTSQSRFKKNVQKIGLRKQCEDWWKNLRESDKLFAPICFLNVLVFLAWKNPSMQNIMYRYFTTGSKLTVSSWPLILSTFSHQSLFHLAANMYVLHNCMNPALGALGNEQFMVLYLLGGTIASFAGVFYRSVVGVPGLALGASGAVLSVISYVCMQWPEGKLGLIFLPNVTVEAITGLKAIMGFDLIGCISGWRFLDHPAHLGGSLFGVFWQKWGTSYLWENRTPILRMWSRIRDPPDK